VAVEGLRGVDHPRARVELPPGRTTIDETLERMRELSGQILAGSTFGDRLVGIGVAAVGAVRSSDGFVHFAPNLDWSNVPMMELVAGKLELGVPVVVRNEADLGARAEHLRGAGAGFDDLIYLSCDVGVGGGIITAGRPLVGASGYAGEVGHYPVNPDGWLCGCGSRGCWETEVGERALLRNAGRDPDGGPDEANAVLRDAEQGSPRALAALASVGRWLGLGMSGLINVFDPQIVVLGGLFGRMAPWTLPMAREQLEARALAITREPVEIVVSRLGVDAPIIGAAERALEPLLADPLRPRPTRRMGPPLVQTGAAM
jgi:predicted NBD/HSP70 family sugar kinase